MLSKEYAKARLVFLTVDPNDISPEKFCSSIEPCSFWALDMVVVQWEGTREMCHQGFEDYIGQNKVHQFSGCSVLGSAPLSSSCLSPSSSVICLATPVVSSYDFVKHRQLFCASFKPHLILFGDLGNQYSDGFSRIWTDFQLFQR